MLWVSNLQTQHGTGNRSIGMAFQKCMGVYDSGLYDPGPKVWVSMIGDFGRSGESAVCLSGFAAVGNLEPILSLCSIAKLRAHSPQRVLGKLLRIIQ
jgi:hypothetical protein